MSDFVQHNAPMNAITEFHMPSGKDMESGMEVLLAEPKDRVEIWQWSYGKIESNVDARVRNRWCVVSNVLVHGSVLTFTANYGGGEVGHRVYPVTTGWLVKRESAKKPRPFDPVGEKREKVRSILLGIHFENSVDETLDSIMAVFGE